MSSPLFRSSQVTTANTPNRFTMSPGYRAFATGVKHAMLADNVFQTFGLYPNNNQMPPVGNQTTRRGNRTRKVTYRKKGVSQKSAVKKTILGMAQTYHRGIPDSTLNVSLLHSNFYGHNLTGAITQSSTMAGRQGDQIYLTHLLLKGFFSTPTTAGAYKYRVLVYYSGEEYNPAGLGASVGPSEVFLPNTFGSFNVNGIPNLKAVTLLYDQTIDVNSTITGVSDIAGVDVRIPLNRKFAYQADGSAYGKKDNLYVTVLGHVVGGVVGVTASGSCFLSADVMFKNM